MIPSKYDNRKTNQNKKGKHFNNEFKGKKSGKAYYDYIEECKRKQELIIKQKLEEVQGNSGNRDVKFEPSNNYILAEELQEIECKTLKTEPKVELPFKSDGSFIEQFKKMRNYGDYELENSTEKLKEIQESCKPNGETIACKIEPKISPRKSSKCVEDDTDGIITPEDPKILIAIENLVNQASLLPHDLQVTYIKQFEDQEEYWFLTLADSAEYSYFHWRLEQAKQDYLKKIEQSKKNSVANNSNSTSNTSSSKKRKSRWNTEIPKMILIPVISQNSQILTDSQKQQVEYQKELQAMHEFITAQQKAKEQELMNSIAGVKYGQAKTKLGQFKFEYDSDEDIQDGTWEHRLRKEEMEATREWADKLNEMGQGKHHIGDFLPPEELDRFMETFWALKEGREPNYSDYTTFKITCENVGFKMLKKMGWKEGDGLGCEGQGIKVPLCNGPVKNDNIGIGVTKMSKLTEFDDEYDAYRKRMMLAYRFRPNPLIFQIVIMLTIDNKLKNDPKEFYNNPRRDYY